MAKRNAQQRQAHLDKWARDGINPDFVQRTKGGAIEPLEGITVEVPVYAGAMTRDNPTGAGTPQKRVSVHSREYFEYLSQRYAWHAEDDAEKARIAAQAPKTPEQLALEERELSIATRERLFEERMRALEARTVPAPAGPPPNPDSLG